MMPDKNGIEVSNIFKMLTPNLPIIIISGFEEYPLLKKSIFNQKDLLKKPFTRDALTQLIEEKLAQ